MPDGILPDASAAALHLFVTSHVQPGARVITDAWMGYHGLAGLGYVHQRRSQRAARDTAAAIGALRRAADGTSRVGIVMFQPAILADLACAATIAGDQCTSAAAAAGEARAALGGRRQAITAAALTYAEGVMA